MFPNKIRKPSEWLTVKTSEVSKAVEKVKKDAPIWLDVSGWSFSPKEIGSLGPQVKRRRMFTGTIYPSEFLQNATTARNKLFLAIGLGLFVLFDVIMIIVLINYLF